MPPVVRIVYDRLPQISAQLHAEASREVRTTAFEVEADIKNAMMGAKSGRIYGSHQASAPGEAPAVDTGNLVNSIVTEAKPGSLTATVSTAVEYAPHLEFGTVNMQPRPAWVPAAERARPRFRDRMNRMLRRLR